MTDPKYAYDKAGVGRYYQHPTTGEEWPSITNILQTSVNKQVLVPWCAKVTAAKAWQMLPQMVAASRSPQKQNELNRIIKGEHKVVKDDAADLGSRIHAIAEAKVLGQPYADDDRAEPYAMQAIRFFEDFGVDITADCEATEATVINREHGYAGTGDLWVWLRLPGTRKRLLYVVDYKSSATRAADSVYPEHGLQVAALAHAETLLLTNGEEIPAPGPIAGAFILNLRANTYALMPMPMAGTLDDAFAGFVGLIGSTRYLHSTYGVKPTAVQPPKIRKVA